MCQHSHSTRVVCELCPSCERRALLVVSRGVVGQWVWVGTIASLRPAATWTHSVQAFVPSAPLGAASVTRVRASGNVQMGLNTMVGSSAPFKMFDPLGFAAKADAATLNKYRESELKHGTTVANMFFSLLQPFSSHVDLACAGEHVALGISQASDKNISTYAPP